MAKPLSFYETVTAAVNDIAENGYDPQRVDQWLVLIAAAAERDMTPRDVMERTLKNSLTAIYARYVDKGAMLTQGRGATGRSFDNALFSQAQEKSASGAGGINMAKAAGVGRFTIENVKPALRAELDRRIMASAQLIRMNRAEAIQKTLHRFSGWSTSIPQGGSDAVDKNEVKKDITKSLKRLPFEERRVLIDQGHKFTAALSETLATDNGAIAVEWHSHWRQANYNYRKDHKERDRKVYTIRNNWAIQRGLMKVGDAGYYDEVTGFGEEVFCRCYGTWIYALRDLPADMLTNKGAVLMEEIRQKIGK